MTGADGHFGSFPKVTKIFLPLSKDSIPLQQQFEIECSPPLWMKETEH